MGLIVFDELPGSAVALQHDATGDWGILALRTRRRGLGFCIAAAMLALVSGTPGQTADATRDRTISLYNIHTEETLTIQYMKAGKHIPEAMEKINWILRDFRKNETTRMDPT